MTNPNGVAHYIEEGAILGPQELARRLLRLTHGSRGRVQLFLSMPPPGSYPRRVWKKVPVLTREVRRAIRALGMRVDDGGVVSYPNSSWAHVGFDNGYLIDRGGRLVLCPICHPRVPNRSESSHFGGRKSDRSKEH